MTHEEREQLIKTSWELHGQVEASYLSSTAKQGDSEWIERQRFLLADMPLHLLQTSVNPGKINLDKLRDNLPSILTISDQFLPTAELKRATEKLYSE